MSKGCHDSSGILFYWSVKQTVNFSKYPIGQS